MGWVVRIVGVIEQGAEFVEGDGSGGDRAAADLCGGLCGGAQAERGEDGGVSGASVSDLWGGVVCFAEEFFAGAD